MSEGNYKDRSMANAGPRQNRRYKNRQRQKPRRAGIPDGATLVMTLDPLRCAYKDNRELRSGNYVYAVKSESGWIKFGHSKSPWSRLSEIQVGSIEKCELIFLINCGKELDKACVERAVHLALGSHRIRGEWFDGEGFGVKRLTEEPWTLPWKVIEGMLRLGIRGYFQHSPYPKHVRPRIEEERIKAVKTQFMAREWGKVKG